MSYRHQVSDHIQKRACIASFAVVIVRADRPSVFLVAGFGLILVWLVGLA